MSNRIRRGYLGAVGLGVVGLGVVGLGVVGHGHQHRIRLGQPQSGICNELECFFRFVAAQQFGGDVTGGFDPGQAFA